MKPFLDAVPWLHPWARPAERKRSARIGAPSPEPPADGLEYVRVPGVAQAPVIAEYALREGRFGPGPRYSSEPRPDPVVFGPSGSGELQAPKPDYLEPVWSCWCGVKWSGKSACWNCGRQVGW